MNSYHSILITIVIVLSVWTITVYAGEVKMKTYYPAPTAYYQDLEVKQGFKIPFVRTGDPEPSAAKENLGSIWIFEN